MIKTLSAGCALAASMLTGAPAMAACEFKMIGEMHVDMSHGVPTVAIQVNGERKRVYINTGADLSILSEAGAAALGATNGDLMTDRTSTAAGEASTHRTQLYNVSIGGAFGGAGDSLEVEHIIARADAAMYAAKQAGRNCVVID